MAPIKMFVDLTTSTIRTKEDVALVDLSSRSVNVTSRRTRFDLFKRSVRAESDSLGLPLPSLHDSTETSFN